MTIQPLLGPNGLMFSVEDQQGNVRIFWGGRQYYSFHRDDLFAKKLGVAILANIGVLHKTICEFFKISRNTVTNILSVYRERGAEGLTEYKQGPGVEQELITFVRQKFVEVEGQRGYQRKILEAIEEKVQAGVFTKGISRTKLHEILREYKEEREERKRRDLEGKEAKERETEQEGKEEEYEADEQQREFLDEEAGQVKEECVERGGAVAAAPFVDAFGMTKYIPEEEQEGNRFNNRELAVSYTLLNAGQIVTVEQDFKHLGRYEMGGIIGARRIPSVGVYRSRIPQIVGRMDMGEVIYESAKEMNRIVEFSPVVYIDGHFMPYYGGSETLWGYYPQKRLAMHGREYFFVHDEAGEPVYAVISDGYRQMRHYLVDVDEKLRGIYGVGNFLKCLIGEDTPRSFV